MSVEVRQLKDHNTNLPFVPVTQWDVVTNKPNIICGDDVSSVSALSLDLHVESKTPIVDKTNVSGSVFDIQPNVMYLFGEKTALNITLIAGESGFVSDYTFQFNSGSVATNLIVPTTVKWLQEPDIQTNKTYVVSIENNLGIIGEWDNE